MLRTICFVWILFLSFFIRLAEGGALPNYEVKENLTLEQKIGQLLMIGFDGELPTEELKEQIQKMNVGGVLLFPRNIVSQKQVQTLTRSIRALNRSQYPILIATDEEGGRVIRFYNDEVTMPSQMAIGAAGSDTLAFEIGRSIAARLSMLGIDINLAPVLDLNIESENRIVGSRSFGKDPEIVSSLGSSYIRGVQSLGISATAKHFPGHGGTKLDSHKSLPRIYSTLEKDLIPFKEAISQDVEFIMTAHISYPRIDKSGLPATISPEIITNILRKKMKYDGLVITDDLEMGAIEKTFGIGEAAVRAIEAGCDMVIVGWQRNKQKEVYSALIKAAKSGRISSKRLDDAVKRITKLKTKKNNNLQNENIRDEIASIINGHTQKGLAKTITDESVMLLKNRDNTIPLLPDENKIIVVSPLYEFYREIRKRSKKVFYVEVSLRPDEEEKTRILKYLAKSSKKVDKIIVGIINKHHAELILRLSKKIEKPLIVVSFDSPHYISEFPDVEAFLSVYHYRTGAAETAARVILGEISTKGMSTISLSSVASKAEE